MKISYEIERECNMYYFIVNTHASTGNAMQIWDSVERILKERNISYKVYETLYAGYATEVARELSGNASEHINIIVVGGDGTINEVVNGILDFSKVSIGLIPAGTGNDFARNLGIKGTPETLLDDIMQCKCDNKLDLGIVHWESLRRKRIFAISSGVGFDALVCKRNSTSRMKSICNALHLGKFSYLMVTVQSIFTLKTFDTDIDIDGGPSNKFKKTIFSCAMNLMAEGGGVKMAPHASAKDGLLSFCVAADIPWYKLPFCLMLLVMAKHEKLPYFHIHICKESHIHTSKPVTLHCDGECLGETTEIWYKSMPGALSILNTIKDK